MTMHAHTLEIPLHGVLVGLSLVAWGCNPLTQSELTRIGACSPDNIIEDAENGDDQAVVAAGRGGYLYTYMDDEGSTIEPSPESFRPAPGGPAQSRYALRFSGTLGASGHDYAGVGLSFVDPKAPYDASAYEGISFFAKAEVGSESHLRVKLPDVATDPEGDLCSECFNDFGIDFAVTEQWTRYVVRWSDLTQATGWGKPRPEAIDATAVYGVQWQVSTPGVEYDISIDDVAFVGGCEG